MGRHPHDPNNLTVTPDRFEEQMATLKRRGLRGLSVAELLAARAAGSARGLVGLTFDERVGRGDAAARSAVVEAGYDHACAVVSRAPFGPHALPRIYVGQAHTSKQILKMLYTYCTASSAWAGAPLRRPETRFIAS